MLDSEQEERWSDPALEKQGEYIMSSREKRNSRMNICKVCDRLALLFCKECACYMPAKTWLDKEVCPQGKW